MIKIAVFDKSCYLENAFVKKIRAELEKSPAIKLVDYDDALSCPLFNEKIGICLYVVPMDSIALNHQVEFITNNPNVRYWNLFLFGKDMAAQTAARNRWNEVLSTYSNIRYQVNFYSDEDALTSLIEDLNDWEENTKSKWIFISNKHSVGISKICELLKENNVEGEFIEIAPPYPEDLDQIVKRANGVFIIGTKPYDFSIPYLKEIENRLFIVLNMCDLSVSSYIHLSKTKKEIIHAMNKNGWNLSEGFKNFYATSALYEGYKQNLENYPPPSQNGEILALGRNKYFVMWDEFGLPAPREKYSSPDVIVEFLKKFDIIIGTITTIMNNINEKFWNYDCTENKIKTNSKLGEDD